VDESQLNFTLQLSHQNTQEVLTQMASMAPINHFLEQVPSANDIFIRTIASKNSND
jgi:ABC-2 type transport system ATP-binding protein